MSDTDRRPAALDAVVRGRVQGVYFRAFAARHAVNLGLTGYVRNTETGDVEIHAEGERGQLLTLVERLEEGPPAARVGEVRREWSEFTGAYRGFVISYRP
ncbi:MAG: acylphosphatase [Dehalococcoidales bacterium]